MDSFARDLFNFAAGLGRAQAKYDNATPKERELLECIQCGGAGKMGCTKACEAPDLPSECPKCGGGWLCPHMTHAREEYDLWQENERFCLKHHTCSRCNGIGDDPLQSDQDLKLMRDCAREDQIGEGKD